MVFIRGNKFSRLSKSMELKKKPVYALQLDGVSGYVSIADSNSLDFTTNFTLVIKIVREIDSGTYERIIAKSDNTTFDYWLQIDNVDKLSTGISGYGYTLASTGTVPIGQQITLIGSYDGVNLRVYINDTKTTGNTSYGEAPVSTKQLWIGRLTTNYKFKGKIFYVATFNTTLTDVNVASLSNGSIKPTDISGCVLYHDYTTGSAQDLSGNGNHGTLKGNANFTIVGYESYYGRK